MKRFINVYCNLIIWEVLNMYFQCQTCGYKYNFHTSEINTKCMICLSDSVRIENPDNESE